MLILIYNSLRFPRKFIHITLIKSKIVSTCRVVYLYRLSHVRRLDIHGLYFILSLSKGKQLIVAILFVIDTYLY